MTRVFLKKRCILVRSSVPGPGQCQNYAYMKQEQNTGMTYVHFSHNEHFLTITAILDLVGVMVFETLYLFVVMVGKREVF